MPKVSVIVPCFNHAKYLNQRLDSILNQSVTDIEVFILDDCSTDNSWEVIQGYEKSPKVKTIQKNEKNSGSPFIQWQKGIEMASGEFIWIAESDDYSEIDFLEKNLAVLEANNSIGVSFCPSIWVDSENVTLEIPHHESEPFIQSGEFLVKNEFTNGCLIYNASSAVFRKKLIQNVDFECINKYTFTGDWLFWVQLIKNTKVARISERLNFFRRHTENVSSKSNKLGLQFSEGFKVVNFIFKNHQIGFVNKQKIYIKWAIKVAKSPDVEPIIALKQLPFQVKFWYNLLPIISIFR
jgi:glycosyltransferase involved in cell wall biosynthesis